ncbi:MAG: hypothetical protein C0613_10655 [Desulfobulbaceae bacterium]|nr:MAG: hypothetical protein C0613_10655 [Desulfobulbaceae bacterium]
MVDLQRHRQRHCLMASTSSGSMDFLRTHHLFIQLAIVLLCLLAGVAPLPAAEDVTIEARVASQEVYVGQPFTLQLEVRGAEAVEQPPLDLRNFKVESQGSSNRSQSYQISINGTLQTTKTLSYIFQYQLTAVTAGNHAIPAISVEVDGVSYQSRPISMTVKEPQEMEEFKVEVTLSKARCYRGEAVIMTTTWFIAEDLKGFDFNLPIFTDQRFTVFPRPPDQSASGQDLVELEVAGQKVIGEKKSARRHGRDYVTITFQHTLIPESTGRLRLPDGTLAITTFAGYRRSQQHSFGMDPFDMFGNGRRKTYRTVVIPARGPELEVLELPSRNRPDDFTGLVGAYSLESTASPTTVNVGDPIELTVRVSGPFVDNLSLPPLTAVLPAADFKTAMDKPQARVNDGIKSFTTTIRARHHEVKSIPGLSLPFFNPETKRYEVARSAAINLDVKPTRLVTADDAVGDMGRSANDAGATTINNAARQDIRPNYENPITTAGGTDKLLYLAVLIVPPLLFGLMLFVDYYCHDDSRELRHRRRQAYRRLRKKLRSADQDDFFELWLAFLSDKLGIPARAITRSDVLTRLPQDDTTAELAAEINRIFDQGEAALYGGLGHVLEKDDLLQVAKKVAKVL